tara:strand:+ start:13 stop:351 length:339 start_codon:yes stop_codon:yes gene_type:complete
MRKKKLLDTLIDLAKRPNKEMARIKKRKKHKKEMAEMKKEIKLKAKQREEEKKFFTPEAVEKRRKETDKRVKAYAARMEREFAKSSKISPSKMKGGGIAIKGYGKAFTKGNK